MIPYFTLLFVEEILKDRTFWLAGELAESLGVSTDTLRYYERKGVLPRPRRAANGYRRYSFESFDRVHLVRKALAVGFTLDELARILGERDRGGAPCREVRALAGEKLAAIEEQLKSLNALKKDLQRTIADWDSRLSDVKPGERAGLLETIENRADDHKTKLSPTSKKEGRKKNDTSK